MSSGTPVGRRTRAPPGRRWLEAISSQISGAFGNVHKDTVSEICRNLAELPKTTKPPLRTMKLTVERAILPARPEFAAPAVSKKLAAKAGIEQ
jgi:hypothetical protein